MMTNWCYVTTVWMLISYLHLTVSEDEDAEAPSGFDSNEKIESTFGNAIIPCAIKEGRCFDMESTTSNPNISIDEAQVRWSFGRMEWPWWTIMQAISSILGVLGNLLVIVVIFRRKEIGRSTNRLVGSLAIADLLTSVFLIPYPRPLSIPDTLGSWLYCKVMHGNFPMWTSINASIYTLVGISFDRFFAVVYPIYFKRLVSQRLVSVLIVLIWLGSTLIPSAGFFIFYVDSDNGRCVTYFVSSEAQLVLGCVTFTFRLIVPTVAMTITQVIIVINLHRQSKRFKTTTPTFHVVARNRIIKLMLIVIILYIICWAPNQIAYFAYSMNAIPSTYYLSPLNRILTVLAFYNSCLNPIIYTIRYPQFRQAVSQIFTCSRSNDTLIFEDDDTPKHAKDTSDRNIASNETI